MKKNDLIRKSEDIFRVLEIIDDKVFLIDCKKKQCPDFMIYQSLKTSKS